MRIAVHKPTMASDHSDSTLAVSEKSSQPMHSAKNPTNENDCPDWEAGQGQTDGPIGGAAAALDLSTPHAERRASGHPASLQPSRGGHGYTAFDKDGEASKKEPEEQDPDKQFEVQWDGDDDPMNPRCMSGARKWSIVIIVSAGSTCVTCASSMYTSTYEQITTEFHVSRVVATLGLSLFVIGLGLGPMVLGPLSEFYGRRPIYVLSFTFFLIWLIPCAVAKNIGTELVARFIDGVAGSAFLSVAGGTVGDMFNRNELQAPMMIFTASPFIGPPIGPLLAGFINQVCSSW